MEEPLQSGQLRPGSRLNSDAELSRPELDFVSRWSQLIDKAGGGRGQAQVAKLLGWATSTASRDYNGGTLPTDERLHQLCRYLQLSPTDTLTLAVLLQEARTARKSRPKSNGAPGTEQIPDSPGHQSADHCEPAPADGGTAPGPDAVSPRGRSWPPGKSWRAAAAIIVVIGAAAVIGVHFGVSEHGPERKPQTVAPAPTDRPPSPRPPPVGTYPGRPLEQFPIPVASLIPSLAGDFRHGSTAGDATITGFEFRNAEDPGRCLSANTGALAGMNDDPVVVRNCGGARTEIWIPEQWETGGNRLTQLVNYQYQSLCLNAGQTGDLSEGPFVRLQYCHPSGSEFWDFGDWYQTVRSGRNSYPVFLGSGPLCLDTDQPDAGAGKLVHVRSHYPTAGQFWS